MLIKNLLDGLIIGLGFIIPGVSGGVLATILGIYEKIIDTLLNLKKDLKNNLLFIVPLLIGILISVLLFSNVILYLLRVRRDFISYVFIGLILGCIPYLAKEIKNKSNKNLALIPFILAFSLGVILFIFQKSNLNIETHPSIITMFGAGVLYAIGKIVPGISGAALLMLIGVYTYFLETIANPLAINLETIITFIPFIISFLISAIIILKLINYLLHQHFRLTYSIIIGFVVSSILFIYPDSFTLMSIVITILAFLLSYNLAKK